MNQVTYRELFEKCARRDRDQSVIAVVSSVIAVAGGVIALRRLRELRELRADRAAVQAATTRRAGHRP